MFVDGLQDVLVDRDAAATEQVSSNSHFSCFSTLTCIYCLALKTHSYTIILNLSDSHDGPCSRCCWRDWRALLHAAALYSAKSEVIAAFAT